MRKLIFIVFALILTLSATAGGFRKVPGIGPGINDGTGSDEGCSNGNNTEITLPIGLPETDSEPVQGSEVNSNIVYAFDLSTENGAASLNQTHSAFEKARDMNASWVLIRISGFAGGWDVAENIRQEIMSYDKPVMVYVNNKAIPAADFISSGADSIYTRKGSIISNQKSKSKSNPRKVFAASDLKNAKPSANETETAVTIASQGSSEYGDDATMNEILYKAGLGNLTVVEHTPGITERAVDLMMNPFMVFAVIFIFGFVIRRTSTSKLPGPMMYVLTITTLMALAPFQLSGLATNPEIIISLILILAILISSRYQRRGLSLALLLSLSLILVLVRAGDTQVLIEYGSGQVVLLQVAVPMMFIVLGWFAAKLPAMWSGRNSVTEKATRQVQVTA